MDWRLLGYGLDEPWVQRSNSAQEKFKSEAVKRTDAYLREVFAPSLKEGITAEAGFEADVCLGDDEETILFAYPKLFSSAATLDVIKLEIGPMAAWSPSAPAQITPYVAEAFPDVFPQASTYARTVMPERTFWEKATILHQEANRPEIKAMPRRYSRHYYDMFCLGNSPILERALEQSHLLGRVVEFKEKFYRTPWSRLSDAKPGSLKLAPPKARLVELERDYRSMRPMLFGTYPRFEEIVSYLTELEKLINSLA